MKRKKNNGSFWPLLIIALIFFPSVVWKIFGFGLAALAILAALVFLIVKLVKSGDDKTGGQTAQKKPENVTVNPYSSHQSYQPQARQTVEKVPEPVKKKSDNPELDLVLTQGRNYIGKIQALNDDIPDFKVSARIKQIEVLAEKIFDYVEVHPDDLRQTRQMLSYYLPTTVKLLERYVELQKQGLRVGNIDESMTKVEELLDKLAVAFQKQLDDMFADDLVDITADIKVMEQMIESEGLTYTKDF